MVFSECGVCPSNALFVCVFPFFIYRPSWETLANTWHRAALPAEAFGPADWLKKTVGILMTSTPQPFVQTLRCLTHLSITQNIQYLQLQCLEFISLECLLALHRQSQRLSLCQSEAVFLTETAFIKRYKIPHHWICNELQ